jgi:hypothetical protein
LGARIFVNVPEKKEIEVIDRVKLTVLARWPVTSAHGAGDLRPLCGQKHLLKSHYEQLFGTSEGRIDVLNRVAPTFFSTLQSVLLDEVQLTLSRLSDPERSERRQNVTLEALMNAIGTLPEPAIAAELAADLIEFRDRCNFIVMRRNHRIAHYDISAQRAAEQMPGASRQEIGHALDGLRKFMQRIYSFYMNSYMAYEHFCFEWLCENLAMGRNLMPERSGKYE